MQKSAVFHLISKHLLNINFISFQFSLPIINEFEKKLKTTATRKPSANIIGV